jgi:hypothetical protein
MQELINIKETRENLFSIFLIVSFAFGTNVLISYALLNSFGIPWLPFQKLYFVFIPALIILKNKSNTGQSFPYLKYFLVLVVVFFVMEKYSYEYNYFPEFDFINQILYLYIGFIIIINMGLQKYFYIKILKYSLVIILFNSALIYLSIYGVISMADLKINELGGRLTSSINMNIYSDMNVLGIFIFYFLKKEGVTFKILNIKIRSEFLIVYLLFLVFINAVRGSILLFSMGLVVYMIDRWKGLVNYKKGLLLAMFLIAVGYILVIDFGEEIANRFFILDRLVNSDYRVEGRGIQILASWNNFLSSPIKGIGFENAATGLMKGITTSNFQYTQILASGGLVLFVLFFTFVLKLFGAKVSYIRNNSILLSLLLFILLLLVFRPLSGYNAIIAYIVYYNKYHFKQSQRISSLSSD